MIARLPGFDDYGNHNAVYGSGEICPTILLNASKGYPPLVLVEVARDDPDKDRQPDRLDGGDGRRRGRPKLPREGAGNGTIRTCT